VVKPKQLSLVNGNGDFEEGAVSLLKGQINSIVKAIQKLLRNKNAKTRQGCFSLLTQLVNVLPGGLANYLAQIIPGINYSLKYV
jgi:cullin-associated NEDD8-dissociated protein 1